MEDSLLDELPLVLRGICVWKPIGRATAPPPAASIQAAFPLTYGGSMYELSAHTGAAVQVGRPLRIAFLISGGPAPGIVEYIRGVRAYLLRWNVASSLLAFRGGPAGLVSGDAVEVDDAALANIVDGFGLDKVGTGRMAIDRAAFPKCRDSCRSLRLDGVFFLGGFSSNTDAALLAEYFAAEKVATSVVAVAKRAEGMSCGVVSFGFDSLTKAYAQLVGNLCADAASGQTTYHFVRVMGEMASHIALEVAFATHPNVTIISEEVKALRWTVADVVAHVCDAICARSRAGKQYGVVLLSEGLIFAISEFAELISEVNRTVARLPADSAGNIAEISAALCPQTAALLATFPPWLGAQLLGERDAHGIIKPGAVQVERFIAQMCDAELRRRKADGFAGGFSFACHFFGYEARLGAVSAFDRALACALGSAAVAAVEAGLNGVVVTAVNVTRPVAEWTCRALPLTSLMTAATGASALTLQPSVVSLASYPFACFARMRSSWTTSDKYRCPAGPMGDDRNATLHLAALEREHGGEPLKDDATRQREMLDLARELFVSQSSFILSRLAATPPIPPALRGAISFAEVPLTAPPTPGSALADPAVAASIAALFPKLSALTPPRPIALVPHSGRGPVSTGSALAVGIVLSGGPAPGGHNVIAGLFDFLKSRNAGSRLFGFVKGPSGLMSGSSVELTAETIAPYRNMGGFHLIGTSRHKVETPQQLAAAAASCRTLGLDGLVVCGGDDSNTNACALAEHFLSEGVPTCVVGVPKTIDADLRVDGVVEMSFGFDTTTKLYSQLVANVMADAATAGNVWHFIRLMGRSASHITLECALRTHPTYTAIAEEVAANGTPIATIAAEIAAIAVKRAAAGKRYGVVLIPEGLVEFAPDVAALVRALNELLGHGGGATPDVDAIAPQLADGPRATWELLPKWLRLQLLAERDPHGNVPVSKIESERLIAALVEAEVRRLNATMRMRSWCHFMGYQGRCGLVSRFDAAYCYTLGHLCGALVDAKRCGYLAAVRGLAGPPHTWTLGAMPLTALMSLERRKGAVHPVIGKKLVDLQGRPFLEFAAARAGWAEADSWPTARQVRAEFLPTASTPPQTVVLETTGAPPIPTSPVGGAAADGAGYPRFEQRS